MTRPTVRDGALDGLRGVAALTVVFFHFAAAFAPALIPQQSAHVLAVTDTPLSVLWNGPYAVIVFFVLSGFVVSASAAKRRHPVVANIGLRWVRLGWPAAASAVFAWGLLSLFPDATLRLQTVLDQPWLNFSYRGQIPSFGAALFDGGVGAFLNGGSDFNNVLWTMRAELIGSVVLYLIFGLTQGRVRWVAMALAALAFVLTHNPHFVAFLTGAALFELRDRLPARLGWPALAFGLLMGAAFPHVAARLGLPELPSILALGHERGVFYVAGATALVYAALVLQPVKDILQGRWARWLGDLSFPLYLVHVPILYTVCAALYFSLPLAALLAVYLVAAFASAGLMLVAVDRPTLAYMAWARSRPPATVSSRKALNA